MIMREKERKEQYERRK
jgi:hypothetical protein